ncbi:hypothetical protein [Macrococcus brunensis]|uniref:hypothetical protein n=1 Tax=Macrococcus brunensis TaxID=198483 RepID=UPI001EF069B1|nr:hypothetical protein [Macrococcus brunensis]ULG71269.1 hypothetical protein MGG12_07940 [Macrococcus brunensis]
MPILENLNAFSNKKLIELCMYFGIKTSANKADMIHSLKSRLFNPKDFKEISKQLTDNEHNMLRYFAEGQVSYCHTSDDTAFAFPVLTRFGYLPYSPDGVEVQVPLELINLYIKIELNDAFPLIKDDSLEDEMDEIRRQFREALERREEDWIKKELDKQIRAFKKDTLYDCLVDYPNDVLKDICRFYKIKGFSSKNKSQLAMLICNRFFEDFTMLEKMVEHMPLDTIEIVEMMVRLDRMHTMDRPGLDPMIFFYYLSDSELFVSTKDVRAHFRAYLKKNELHPVVTKKLFYRRLLHFYGAVDYEHLHKMAQKLLDENITLARVKRDIKSLFSHDEVIFSSKGIKHSNWEAVDVDELERPPYYEPTLKELEPFLEKGYINKTHLRKVLKKHARHAHQFEIETLDREIRKGIRVCLSIEDVLNFIAGLIDEGLFEEELMTDIGPEIVELMKEARFWATAGNQIPQSSLQSQQRQKARTPRKGQVMKKSKKRKKNTNVARVVRLDEYR